MAHEEWLERAEIYGLSALDGDELTQFEAHLAAGCPVCERHVRETRESLAVLARSLAPSLPRSRSRPDCFIRLPLWLHHRSGKTRDQDGSRGASALVLLPPPAF